MEPKPWEQSFLEIMPSNVWVLAIKRAERLPDGTILRLQERSGKATQATLKSSALGSGPHHQPCALGTEDPIGHACKVSPQRSERGVTA